MLRLKKVIPNVSVNYVLMPLFLVFFFGPIAWMIVSSLNFDGSQILSHYVKLFEIRPVIRIGMNSIIVAGISTFTTVLFGSMAGYALAKLKFWGREVLLAIVLISVMFPVQVNLVPLFLIVRNLGLFDTLTAAIIPHIIYGLGVFLFRQFYLGLPDELLEAARIDGCGELRLWWRIVLPLSKPVSIAVSILTFFKVYEDVMWPLIVIKAPRLMTASQAVVLFLSGTYNMNVGLTMALGTIFTLPIIVLFLFLQKFFVQGITLSGLKM